MRSSTARWLLAGFVLLLAIPAWVTTFNIADGDVIALISAINTANGNGEVDANGAFGLDMDIANNDEDEHKTKYRRSHEI